MLYNPSIRLASRCGFISRYTVHLPTPVLSCDQLRSFFPRGAIPSLLRSPSTIFPSFFPFSPAPLYRKSSGFCASDHYTVVQLHSYTDHLQKRWSYPCVREQGVNTFSQSWNWQKRSPSRPQFKKTKWNALWQQELVLYEHLIRFVRRFMSWETWRFPSTIFSTFGLSTNKTHLTAGNASYRLISCLEFHTHVASILVSLQMSYICRS